MIEKSVSQRLNDLAAKLRVAKNIGEVSIGAQFEMLISIVEEMERQLPKLERISRKYGKQYSPN